MAKKSKTRPALTRRNVEAANRRHDALKRRVSRLEKDLAAMKRRPPTCRLCAIADVLE